jgi:hypothetical protein
MQVHLMVLGPEHGLVFVIKLDSNALSAPDDIYCLSFEGLCCLLRVPAAYHGLLDFVARSKKYLRYRAVGCFTTADSLSTYHSLPQHDNQVK